MNFYSYTHEGMEYHETAALALERAEKAVRELSFDPQSDIGSITWGEVVKRAVNAGAGYVLKRQDRLSYEAMCPQVVDGRMLTPEGDLRRIENIHEMDLIEHDMVLDVVAIWLPLSDRLQRFKLHNFEDTTTFVDMLYEKYKVKRGGEEKGLTLTTFDRKYKLVISIQKLISFGPEIEVAKTKMLEAIEQAGGNSEFKTLVTAAFTMVDGKLRVAEILRLRTIKIENALWNEAMQIVNDAIEVISKKRQIRLYQRNEAGKYDNIPLDIAAL
ncbi:DUF3164 family protein [Geobacter sp. SVR]|uniref:DUF3164 family protein n=1 Tax=Geobacter sp. SVR TaxID=2495594 RepID=UPI00143F0491|nr:DUF3164 family protein [Geobacter sp. SVR]BCS54530.1 hypothetical protein GSVR_28380 [Geobacter sp. SVR]GCF87130.1 hypothetical protein GSbR_37300 [Geobacter sp. SVR]